MHLAIGLGIYHEMDWQASQKKYLDCKYFLSQPSSRDNDTTENGIYGRSSYRILQPSPSALASKLVCIV